MWIFGRKRPSRGAELAAKFEAATERYLRERDELTPAEAGALAAFFMHVSDSLQESGANDCEQLPAARADTLLAVHAAIFEDDATFATALPGRSAPARDFLRKLRADAATLRQPRAPRPAVAAAPSAPHPPRRIDLESLLGPKDPDTRHARLLDWLRRQPPDPELWHEIVVNSDPDGMDEIFLWIVSQPACDAATAAHIFHACNAFEVLAHQKDIDTPAWRDLAAIARTIVRRWTNSDFPTCELSFEEQGYEESLATYRDLEAKAAAELGAPAFVAPEGLFVFRAGRAPRTEYFYSDFEPFRPAPAS